VLQWIIGWGLVPKHFSADSTIYFKAILPKSGQLILDVGSITQEAHQGTPKPYSQIRGLTYVKALETSDSVDHSRGLVSKHFSANSTIDFKNSFAQKWSIDP